MRDLTDTALESLDPASLDCLQRTRSGVLNVLVGVGAVVAVSGFLLRGRTEGALIGSAERFSHMMLLGLLGVFMASTILRRSLCRRARFRDPRMRGWRFFWGHILPASLGALAAPLGLIQGWLVSPRLESILPFWVVALVLGILAYPRGRELEGLDPPWASPVEPA
jgi:hypothetical protein